MNQKGSTSIVLLIGLVVILGGALGYTVLMQQAAKSDAIILPQDDSQIINTPPAQKNAQPAAKNSTAPASKLNSDTSRKRYSDSRYGFSFEYPSDWKLEQTEYGAHASKTLPDGSKLSFGVAKIGQISYVFQNDTKGTFLGKEAYFKAFTSCNAEGGNSLSECYLKLIKIVLGNKQVYDQTYQQDIRADALDITYGVSKDVARTPTNSEHTNYQTKLTSVFAQNKALFDELLQTVEIVE